MRIAYSTDQLLPRTATDAEQTLSMIAALGRSGAEMTLIAPAHRLRRRPSTDELAAFYEVDPTFSTAGLRSLFPTFRGLEKVSHAIVAARSTAAAGADVLYTRNLPTVLAALRYGNSPVVYETYRPWPLQRPRRTPMFRRIFEHARFAGAVLHSELAAASYRSIGAREDQLLVAHNGYDPRRMEPILDQGEARDRIGLSAVRPVVTYAGHVSPRKGLDVVLDMARALPETLFVIVGSRGDGPIERRAAELANVRIVPWQPFAETTAYLYAADVLLIPPTRKPLDNVGNTVLPMKTFLYMAANRPILGPATPDLTEVLSDGVSARLVPPDEPSAAVAALQALLDDASLRTRLAAAARTTVQSWDERAEQILAFLYARLDALD